MLAGQPTAPREAGLLSLRAAMGEETVASAWAEGRALALDAAIAEALEASAEAHAAE